MLYSLKSILISSASLQTQKTGAICHTIVSRQVVNVFEGHGLFQLYETFTLGSLSSSV